MCSSVYSDDDHHFAVQSELIPVAANWKNIGSALGLNLDVIDNIDTSYSGDPHACLSLMVTEWLKRNYNVEKFGEPTWKRLVEVVGHPAGGANVALARKIDRRHKTGGMSSGFLNVDTNLYIITDMV